MGRRKKEEDEENLAPEKYGKKRKYDPAFHGPIPTRSPTDVLCCLLFVFFLIGWVAVAVIGVLEGDPQTLILPTDSKGRKCGVDPGVSDKPFLFFFDLIDCFDVDTLTDFNCPTPQVCVKSCPDFNYFPLVEEVARFDPICVDGINATKRDDFERERRLIRERKCAPYYLETQSVYGRCVPSFLLVINVNQSDVFNVEEIVADIAASQLTRNNVTLTVIKKAVSFVFNFGGTLQIIYDDFLAAWYIILLGLLGGALLSFLWCFIMRFVAGLLVWGSLLALYVLLGAGIYFCYNEYMELSEVPGSMDDLEFTLDLSYYLRLQNTWFYCGIILCALLGIFILVSLCLCRRIRIAISLIKESSKAVTTFSSSLFWPFIPAFLQFSALIFWAVVAVYLATSKTAKYVINFANVSADAAMFTECDPETFESNGTEAQCLFNSYKLPEYHKYLQFYNLVGFIWVFNFIIGLSHVTLAGVFACYFWAYDKKKDIHPAPLARSLCWALKYHLGSIAFGSLLISLVQIVRIILEYIEYQLKGREGRLAKFILACLKCVFWCLEKFLKFLNRNAYIMIAIYGKNFCTSAKSAFFLLMRNIVRVAVVNKITDFLLFIGAAMVTTATVVLAFFYFSFSSEYSLTAFIVSEFIPVPPVRYYWIIIFVIGLGTFGIARIFFGVFDMAVDTLFISFLEDLERHDGSPERPYYMSKDLMKIVGKKNKDSKVMEW